MEDGESEKGEVEETESNLSLCTCRICQTFKSREGLISPCHCRGTLGKVHLSCLERWLNISGKPHCEICKYKFTVTTTRRYKLFHSIRIWARHPRHRILLRSDLIVAVILTSVTIALCCICAFGMRYFVLEGLKLGIPAVYTQSAIMMFLFVMVLGYLVTMYLMARDHVIPWYRWWTHCLIIKIIVTEDERNSSPFQNEPETSKTSALNSI